MIKVHNPYDTAALVIDTDTTSNKTKTAWRLITLTDQLRHQRWLTSMSLCTFLLVKSSSFPQHICSTASL